MVWQLVIRWSCRGVVWTVAYRFGWNAIPLALDDLDSNCRGVSCNPRPHQDPYLGQHVGGLHDGLAKEGHSSADREPFPLKCLKGAVKEKANRNRVKVQSMPGYQIN